MTKLGSAVQAKSSEASSAVYLLTFIPADVWRLLLLRRLGSGARASAPASAETTPRAIAALRGDRTCISASAFLCHNLPPLLIGIELRYRDQSSVISL
jgi:hypothetical protein